MSALFFSFTANYGTIDNCSALQSVYSSFVSQGNLSDVRHAEPTTIPTQCPLDRRHNGQRDHDLFKIPFDDLLNDHWYSAAVSSHIMAFGNDSDPYEIPCVRDSG